MATTRLLAALRLAKGGRGLNILISSHLQDLLKFAWCIRWTWWRPDFKFSEVLMIRNGTLQFWTVFAKSTRMKGSYYRFCMWYTRYRLRVSSHCLIPSDDLNCSFLSFYKGILPPILAETPKRAVKFLTFEQYKDLFVHLSGSSTAGPEVSWWLIYFCRSEQVNNTLILFSLLTILLCRFCCSRVSELV